MFSEVVGEPGLAERGQVPKVDLDPGATRAPAPGGVSRRAVVIARLGASLAGGATWVARP